MQPVLYTFAHPIQSQDVFTIMRLSLQLLFLSVCRNKTHKLLLDLDIQSEMIFIAAASTGYQWYYIPFQASAHAAPVKEVNNKKNNNGVCNTHIHLSFWSLLSFRVCVILHH